MEHNTAQEWDEYVARERTSVSHTLATRGFTLDDYQPHILGERYLMQAVTTASGKKLILLGTRTNDGMRVVIKVTQDEAGKKELRHERLCRNTLHEIRFAYQIFHTPKEVLFEEIGGRLYSIQEFIEQEVPFTERPLTEQFSFALTAFKAQESARATTYEHIKRIERTFGHMNAAAYQARTTSFIEAIEKMNSTSDLRAILKAGQAELAKSIDRIEQYGEFLTHTDFVPHNFRIVGDNIYLLDASSLRFGNKYEGWARFLNFMTLYNPQLEAPLVQYVRDNRTPEELEALRAMRIYRLMELLTYYHGWLPNVNGDLETLTHARINFWTAVLSSQVHETPLPEGVRTTYIEKRDFLRSSAERERQKGLH